MAGSSWGSLDNGMHKLMLGILQNRYPAKVKQIFAVEPNWYASAAPTGISRFAKGKAGAICAALLSSF